ncbi:MAG: hypothetical protein O2916_08450 [Proteobacteria bacterium]|jgi:hypothetical protein|nr:hypothetical protein [Pseudomonadota bacterium]
MFAIKIWLTKNENDWFYLRDPKDQVIHAWGRKEKAEIVLKSLTCFKAELVENLPAYGLLRVNKKKQKQ